MTPLVLLHGFSGSPSSWDEVLAYAASARAVVRPTIGGHDGVAPPSSFEDEVDRIADEIRSAAGPAHLCGYSLGGRLAVGLLARHPGAFTGATLIGANFGLEAASERQARAAQDDTWAKLIEDEGLESFVARWESQALFATQANVSPGALAAQRAQRLRHDPKGLAATMRALSLSRMPFYEEAIVALDLPVRLVTGALDAKFTAIAQRLLPSLRRGEHQVVDGAGHNVLLERPDAVAGLLARVS